MDESIDDEARLSLIKRIISENGKNWESWDWSARFNCFTLYLASNSETQTKILDLVRTDVDYGFVWYLGGVD